MRVRWVVPGRGMISQASSHVLNRSSGNKTSEDGEAKDVRIKRLAHKSALQRRKSQWKSQSEQRLCKPRAGAWSAPLLLTCSGGARRHEAVATFLATDQPNVVGSYLKTCFAQRQTVLANPLLAWLRTRLV